MQLAIYFTLLVDDKRYISAVCSLFEPLAWKNYFLLRSTDN
jgi:hypothetical protein